MHQQPLRGMSPGNNAAVCMTLSRLLIGFGWLISPDDQQTIIVDMAWTARLLGAVVQPHDDTALEERRAKAAVQREQSEECLKPESEHKESSDKSEIQHTELSLKTDRG